MAKGWLFAALCVLGCDDVPRGPVIDPSTGMTVATCGMPAYTLLARSEVGKLLASDDSVSQWDQAQLDALVTLSKIKLKPVPRGARTIRYRYTTQARGQRVEATGMLAFPSGGAAVADPPTLLWLHGTTGWSDPCAPGLDSQQQGVVAIFASQGFVVVAPDYIGLSAIGAASTMNHPWLVGEPTAIAAWDALPAAGELLQKVGQGLSLSKRVVLAGASQGGHASLFTERLAPYYAPDYQIVAQAAVVPASSMVESLDYLVTDAGQTARSILPPFLVSYRDWYQSPANLSGVFTDSDPHRFASRADQIVYGGACVMDVEYGQAQSIGEVLTADFIGQATQLAPWRCYMEENSIATTSNAPKKTSTPILFTVGENDEIVPSARMQKDVAKLCALGYPVEHVSCAGAGHVNAAFWVLPQALDWIKDRVDGKPLDPTRTCKLNAPVCCSGNPACP